MGTPKKKRVDATIPRKAILKELRQYQRWFRQGGSEVWLEDCRRAIYVLRSLLGISWDAQTDPYLGFEARKRHDRPIPAEVRPMMIFQTKRYAFSSGFLEKWSVPPDGNHSPKADVSKWPRWKFFQFATNPLLFVGKERIGQRYWIYTRFKFGAIHLDINFKEQANAKRK